MDEGSEIGAQTQDGQNLYQPQIIAPSAPPQAAPTAPAQPPEMQPPTAPQPTDLTTVSDEQANQASFAAPQTSKPEVSQDNQGPITWTASEFIANQKSANWYALLAVAAVVIGAVVWLLTRDLFPTIAVLVGVVLLGVYAGRQPREQSYALDNQGLTIGSRHYAYHEFRSFAVVPDGAFVSIELAPLKRFAVDTTIYVDPNDEDRIITRLSQYLPVEEAKPSFTDGLMRRIKF